MHSTVIVVTEIIIRATSANAVPMSVPGVISVPGCKAYIMWLQAGQQQTRRHPRAARNPVRLQYSSCPTRPSLPNSENRRTPVQIDGGRQREHQHTTERKFMSVERGKQSAKHNTLRLPLNALIISSH